MYADDDNYVKLDFVADNAGGPAGRRGGSSSAARSAATVQNPQPQVGNLTAAVWHLRLAKAGDTYTASYSADGTDLDDVRSR